MYDSGRNWKQQKILLLATWLLVSLAVGLLTAFFGVFFAACFFGACFFAAVFLAAGFFAAFFGVFLAFGTFFGVFGF